MDIQFTFDIIAFGIAKLFILMLVGFMLYRFKLIDDKFTDTLSLLLVRIIFPALIISRITEHFSFHEFKGWWFFPLAAVALYAIGLAVASLAYLPFKNGSSRKEFITGAAFQNCGYLPINLILFSFAGAVGDRLMIYVFLFIVGFNVMMWSFVPLFLSSGADRNMKMKALLNPPVIATILALGYVALMGKASLAPIIADPLRQLGHAAFPIAMLVIGAYLCRFRAFLPENKGMLIMGVLTRLIFIPAIVLFLLMIFDLSPDRKFFVFLEAIMPTAVSLVMIGTFTGADNRFFSSIIFYTHAAAIFTIPMWLAVYNIIFR